MQLLLVVVSCAALASCCYTVCPAAEAFLLLSRVDDVSNRLLTAPLTLQYIKRCMAFHYINHSDRDLGIALRHVMIYKASQAHRLPVLWR